MKTTLSHGALPIFAFATSACLLVADWFGNTAQDPKPQDPQPRARVAAKAPTVGARNLRLNMHFPAMSHDALVQHSDRIVAGTVRSIEPFEFRDNWISRRVTFDVFDHWGLTTDATIDVVLHGGRLGSSETRCDASPDLEVGRSYVLYLQSPWERDEHILVAGAQAVVPMSPDGKGSFEVGAAASSTPLDELKAADQLVIEGTKREWQIR